MRQFPLHPMKSQLVFTSRDTFAYSNYRKHLNIILRFK